MNLTPEDCDAIRNGTAKDAPERARKALGQVPPTPFYGTPPDVICYICLEAYDPRQIAWDTLDVDHEDGQFVQYVQCIECYLTQVGEP